MTRAAILAAIALTSCAPQPALEAHQLNAVKNFVKNECGADELSCIDKCKDEFWRDENLQHRDLCILTVTRKFREGERT